MKVKIIEATQTEPSFNWGKFLVMKPDDEWDRRSALFAEAYRPLLAECGWGRGDIIVFDLQTCEGAAFSPHGFARADLNKHRIHVCVLFEDFLTWLYRQDLTDLEALPDTVALDGAAYGMYGYRRPGVQPVTDG